MTGSRDDKDDVYCFVDDYIESFVCWDIILFFFHNPESLETSDSLAARLGRHGDDVVTSVDHLTRKHMLKRSAEGLTGYDPSPELADKVAFFIDALSDNTKRLSILGQVLMKGKVKP